jgi:hypothetical protein
MRGAKLNNQSSGWEAFTRLVNRRNVMGWGECVKEIREKKLKIVIRRISLSKVVG